MASVDMHATGMGGSGGWTSRDRCELHVAQDVRRAIGMELSESAILGVAEVSGKDYRSVQEWPVGWEYRAVGLPLWRSLGDEDECSPDL